MRRTALRIALFLSAFVIVAFAVFLVNQTAQLVALADRAHPLLGEVLFWTLLALYAFCLLVPAYRCRTARSARAPASRRRWACSTGAPTR
jgi:hypothetical protein